MNVEAVFVHGDGRKERHRVERGRAAWQLPERTGRAPVLLSVGAHSGCLDLTFGVLTFHRFQYVYPENWQGPVESYFDLVEWQHREADPHERADMELWTCVNCGRDYHHQPARCGECQWTKFSIVGRWMRPYRIVESLYVEDVVGELRGESL